MHKRNPEFACLQYVHPGCPPKNIAILLLDHDTDSLMMRFTDSWCDSDKSDWDILFALSEDLHTKASECGGAAVFAYLKNTLSNTLRMSDTQPIVSYNLEAELDRLEDEYIKRPLPIVTSDPPSLWSVVPPRSTLIMQYIVTGVGRGMVAAGQLRSSVRGIRRDIRYALASGSFVVLIVVAGGNLLSNTESVMSYHLDNGVGINTPRHPAANPHIDSEPSPTAGTVAAVTPPSTSKRKNRKRPARYTVAPRRFIPPPRSPQLPESPMMALPDLEATRSRAELPNSILDLALSAAPPPYQRPSGIRRILQALVHPFKVLK